MFRDHRHADAERSQRGSDLRHLEVRAKNNDLVIMAFTASHPANFGTYAFSLIKGVNGITVPGTTSGPVSAVVSPLSDTVAHLLASCNVAGFAEYVYVWTTINNGWGRQSSTYRRRCVRSGAVSGDQSCARPCGAAGSNVFVARRGRCFSAPL